MKKENRKETLTREVLQKELKEIYLYNLLIQTLFTVCYYGGVALLFFLFFSKIYLFDVSNYADVGKKLIVVVGVVIAIIFISFAIVLLYSLYTMVSRLIAICNNKFEIIVDKLVDRKEKRRKGDYSIDEMELPEYRIPIVFNNVIQHYERTYIINKLCFSRYKWFNIPEGKLYRWSDKYSMEHWAVYRWAEIGDEFYVVTVKDKAIYAYNTKHFKLNE